MSSNRHIVLLLLALAAMVYPASTAQAQDTIPPADTLTRPEITLTIQMEIAGAGLQVTSAAADSMIAVIERTQRQDASTARVVADEAAFISEVKYEAWRQEVAVVNIQIVGSALRRFRCVHPQVYPHCQG